MKKVLFIFFASVCFLSLHVSALANEVSFPLSQEEVQQKAADYDPSIRVEVDEGDWLENQTVFSLYDENGEQIALLGNTGEDNTGLITFYLQEKGESVSCFYDGQYETVMKFVIDLFGIEFTGDETWERKLEILESEKLAIDIHYPAYETFELVINLYNSPEYNPHKQ